MSKNEDDLDRAYGDLEPMYEKDRDKSFWSTIPGILTGVAAIITAIGGLVAALYTAGIIGGRSTSPNEIRPSNTASGPQATTPLTSRTPAIPSGDCLSEYFRGIREDRVFALEEGTSNFTVIGREQTKEDPIGLRLTDNRQTVGALRFSFFLNGEIFKIESIVDATCGQVKEYSIEGRPGEKRTLQNWDTLQITFGSRTYALRLEFSGGSLGVNKFVRFVQ